MNNCTEPILQNGRPDDTSGRLKKEIAVYDLLDSLQISYQRVDHEPAFTMEACSAIDKALSPAVMCKNLLLCNAKKTDFYLLLIRGDKKFVTKEVSRAIGCSRLSFAPGEYMEQFLNITPGSLSVFGLMNDCEKRVKLIIDEDLLQAVWIGCHPCVNTSSLRIYVADLIEKFLPAVRHDYTAIPIPAHEEPAV